LRYRSERLARSLLAYGILVLFIAWSLFPVYWMVSTSFKGRTEYLAVPPHVVPEEPTLAHYEIVLFRMFGLYNPERVKALEEELKKVGSIMAVGRLYEVPPYINSLIVASVSTVITVLLGTPSAFSLARYRFKGRENIANWILSVRMFPPIVVVVPIFILYRWLNLIDTQLGLIVMYTIFNLPFAIWMLRGFIRELPVELEECAMTDGCSRLGAFRRITLPLLAPSLAATAAFCFLFAWNEYLFALIFTRSRAVTLPVSLQMWSTHLGPEWGELSSLAALTIVPPLLLVYLLQKHIVSGLTFGAIKG